MKKEEGRVQKHVSNHFSVSQFAKICGMTRDGVIYYDNIDLIKPVHVTEKGYREYSVGQIFNFELINILKSFDMSLDEIKNLLNEDDIEVIEDLLKSKDAHFEEEIARQRRSQGLVRQLADMTHRYRTASLGNPFFENRKAERLILSEKTDRTGKDFIPVISKHFENCREVNYGTKYPMGGMVEMEHLLSGNFNWPDYYFTFATQDTPNEITFEKPGGEYAIIFHKGFYNTLRDSCNELLEYIEKSGGEVIGNLYENDLISNFKTINRNEFIMELSVQVRKENKQ